VQHNWVYFWLFGFQFITKDETYIQGTIFFKIEIVVVFEILIWKKNHVMVYHVDRLNFFLNNDSIYYWIFVMMDICDYKML
jgi:hypothetical protein